MAFKLQPNPTFKATVAISQPGEGAEPLRVRFEFRHLSRSQYREQIDEPKLSFEDACKLVTIGWEVEDDPWSPERFEAFLNDFPAAPVDIYATWHKETRETKRKN
jgi:hypothetical protein